MWLFNVGTLYDACTGISVWPQNREGNYVALCDGSLPPFYKATDAQRWVIGQARTAAAATAAASAAPKAYPIHAPDTAAVAAAAASSGIALAPAAAATADAAAATADTNDAMVPVTLLTGTPDGCQAGPFLGHL
jgi:hypothetical protein